MKQQRLRFKIIALILFLLFALMIAYGGYSISTYGNRWFSSQRNPRVRYQKENVLAGKIIDRNGVVLAASDEEGNRIYQKDRAARSAVVHLIGDQEGNVSNGIESFQTSYLYGFQTSLPELVSTALSGQSRHGDNLTITIDSELCTAIPLFFQRHTNSEGKNGAAVVMNYLTGEVVAPVSLPNFDPMNITEETKQDPASPFWNRVIQAVYPPGSTFKTVTASAALKNLDGIEDILFTCDRNYLDFGDHLIGDYQGEHHGTITLKQAYAESCNKMFATIALNVGQKAMQRAAEDFGFNDNFLFRDLVVENSSYPSSRVSDYELAASGFGQASVAATPMHMCMIAAAIANQGIMMEPRILRDVTSYAGINRLSFTTKQYKTALTAQESSVLKRYMRSVITEGTGSRAAVKGMTICGKTGTADSTANGKTISYGWFIGFNDDPSLPFALAILVEDLNENTSGGTTAAPIARDIFTYLKDHPDRVQ